MKTKRITVVLSWVLFCIALAQFLWFQSDKGSPGGHRHLVPMQQSWIKEAQAIPLEGFQLLDTEERPFRPSDFQGRWHILLFGYTACPDVCPTTLRVLSQALNGLKRNREALAPQAVFISVDPQRDSPSRLSAYLAEIDDEFIGLTGSPSELKRLLHTIGSDYAIDKETGRIAVNHPTTLFLVNPQGRYVGLFAHSGQSDHLKTEILKAMEGESGKAS